MPGPGERDTPDDDDLIGFASAASLRGQSRGPTAEPAPAAPAAAAAAPPAFGGAERRRTPRPAETPDAFRLYTVYVLILLTVPSLGAAGLAALLAVWKRAPMADALARSHAVYQRRTLVISAAAAAAGVVLMAAPFALGVPLLFLTALWLILRGAVGVWLLKSGQPVRDPRGWWVG